MARKTNDQKECKAGLEAIEVQILPSNYLARCGECSWHHGCSDFGHVVDEVIEHTGTKLNTIRFSAEKLRVAPPA